MTRRIAHILVPTDFSETSEAALTYATILAEKFEASLHLVHVFEDPFLTGAYAAEVYAPLSPDARDALIRDAQAQLAERVSRLAAGGLHVASEVVVGIGAQAIVEYAGRHDIDLIVMGTHGRQGMAHLLLGSVAERVVRSAPCPVLTVRGHELEAIDLPQHADTDQRMPAAG